MDKIDVLSWTSHVHMKDSHFYNCTTKNIKYVDNYELIAVIKNRLFKILAHRKMKIINEEINNLLLVGMFSSCGSGKKHKNCHGKNA